MNENQNFFDTRTIIALVIVAAGFIGWEFHMRQKYPDYYNKKDSTTQTQTATEAKNESEPAAKEKPVENKAAPKSVATAPAEEKIIPIDTPNLAFELSSQGMSLKNFKIKKYTDRKGEIVEIGHPEMSSAPMETRLIGHAEPLNFAIEKINDNMYVGHAKVGALEITKTVELDPDKYLFHFKIATQGSDPRFVGLTTSLTDEVETVSRAKGFLLPQFEQQEFFIHNKSGKDHVSFGKEDLDKSWSGVNIAAVSSQYFMEAIIDKSPVIPDAKGLLKRASKAAEIVLQYPVLNQGQNFQLEYDAYVGPKSQQALAAINPDLAQAVNFGYFSWIAQYLLVMLKGFYSLVGNWGWAIILLTVVVRGLVLPINLYSFKSMKAMQAIQPQIQSLKERYKDDQQRQQAEVMKLMKENKVNPVGGCLPMLLQFPIFFALYRVLEYSIELYQAPFVFWIRDLSVKDPYYILPVLMGVTMFFQQKLSPNPSVDPAQAKLMLMMPLIFTFFMVSLPSGLTLYMFVGAVFGVIQQLYFLRGSSSLASRGK